MSEPKSPRKPVVMRPAYTDLVDPNEAPRAAHVVNFNRVGTDVLMAIGFVDIAKLATGTRGG